MKLISSSHYEQTHMNSIRGGLTRSSPIKGCFLEQETLPLLLSTGWFQERSQA